MKKILLYSLIFLMGINNSTSCINNNQIIRNNKFNSAVSNADTSADIFNPAKYGYSIGSEYKLYQYYDGNLENLEYDNKIYGIAGLDFAAVYTYYDQINDSMYYACLARTSIQPYQDTYDWDYGFFSKDMKLNIKLTTYGNQNDVKISDYYPKTAEKNYSESWSYSSEDKLETNSLGTITYSHTNTITYTNTVSYTSISTRTIFPNSYYGEINFDYHFNKWDDTKYRDDDACHFYIDRDYVSIFKVNYYSTNAKLRGVNIKFIYTPIIYRDGVWNDTHYNDSIYGARYDSYDGTKPSKEFDVKVL